MIENKIKRTLAIEAAVHRLIMLKHPDVSASDIQKRGSIDVGSGYMVLNFDGNPVAMIDLVSETQFKLTILD